MSDIFERLTRAGNVEVLGAPAILSESISQDAVRFYNNGFKSADEVNLGLTGIQEWAAAPNPLTPNYQDVPNPTLDLPFSTQRVTIPSTVAPFFVISNVKIAAIQLIEGQPVCGEIFSEVSLNNGVRWPTAQTGQNIRMTLGNTDTANAYQPRVSLTGIRLRS